MILGDYLDRPFQFWDMYNPTNLDGLKDPMLVALEDDARASLTAAQAAAPLVQGVEAKTMLDRVLNSAERRLYLATSARHLLRAVAAEKAGDKTAALAAMQLCLAEGDKLERAATRMGIEYPMATHDDEVVARYRAVRARIAER